MDLVTYALDYLMIAKYMMSNLSLAKYREQYILRII